MKAVLGFLFLLSGLTVGYLVLSGKLPNTSITPVPTQVVPGQKGDKSVGKQVITPTGVPATSYNGDMKASGGIR